MNRFAASAQSSPADDAPGGGAPLVTVDGASVEALAHSLATGKPDTVRRFLSGGLLVPRTLLGPLRAALLAEWSEKPRRDASAMVAVLQRLEELEGDLPDARRAALLGSGGLDTAAEIAHDFRSPLGSVLMLTDTLRRGQSGPLTELQRAQLGIIYSAALALSSFAEDIIDFVRGGDALMDPEPLPFSLGDLLTSLRDFVQPVAEGKAVELRIGVSGPDLRSGYPLVVHRVLLNLVTNALKYTDAGVVEVTATPLTEASVRFEVRDSGQGLPGDVLARIRGVQFDAVNEGDRRRVCSSALGLGICMNLLQTVGSDLQVESSTAGTHFQFDLLLPPYLMAECGEESAAEADSGPSSRRSVLAGESAS